MGKKIRFSAFLLHFAAFLFQFSTISAQTTPVVKRSSDVVTVEDARLDAKWNLGLPRYQDTAAANLHLGTDSCGRMIFTYDSNQVWKRSCNPKRWEKVGGSGSGSVGPQGIPGVAGATGATGPAGGQEDLLAYAALGGSFKAEPIGQTANGITTSMTMGSGRFELTLVYLPTAATITGVKFYQVTAGSYTADAYNGIGLYSVSAGVLTLVASSTNNGALWSSVGGGWNGTAFSSTYAAAAGVYYVGFLYHSSAQTTAPGMGAGWNVQAASAALDGADFANSMQFRFIKTTVSSFPSPITMSTAGYTTGQSRPYLALY